MGGEAKYTQGFYMYLQGSVKTSNFPILVTMSYTSSIYYRLITR